MIASLALNFPFVSFEESKRRRDSYTFMMDVNVGDRPELRKTKFSVKLYGYYLDDQVPLGEQDIEDIVGGLSIRGGCRR